MSMGKSLGHLEPPKTAAPPQQIDIEQAIEAAPRRRQAKKAAPAIDPIASRAWIRGEGKSSNPDYERLCVLIRRDTRKDALRKWEDEPSPDGKRRDASDLVQMLLSRYINE